MARRIELKGIANALNESFVSRNNDFKGYWAIGQLKLFAIYNNLTTMQFSLTPLEAGTYFGLRHYIVCHYADILGHLLRKQQIPDIWVSGASITIDFNVNAKRSQLHERSGSGEPFQCCCRIIDDTGRSYSSIIYGKCKPHSTAEEMKSTRKFTM